MAIYDGVVTLSDNNVPVIVELTDDAVRLSASGTEIGEWSKDECDITRSDAATYLIHAESEALEFVPSSPGAFGAAIGLTDGSTSVPLPPDAEPVKEGLAINEAPPPRSSTMALFYALCVLTLALMVWAGISLAL